MRLFLLVLTAGDLALLGLRLQPWNAIPELPGQGNTAYDPLICLAAYLVILFWATGIPDPGFRKAVRISTILGLGGGVLLAVHLFLPPLTASRYLAAHLSLLGGAALLWTIACVRSSDAANHFGIGIVGGIWSAMVSALVVCATILLSFNSPAQAPWNPLQLLPFHAPATESLVSALNTATAFLLISPLVGTALGLICGASYRGKQK